MSQLRNQGIIRCAISCNGKVIGQNHHYNKALTLSQLFSLIGDQNTSTVESARGKDAHFRNGIRRPSLAVHRSDQDAIIGSVKASKILPKAVIPPIIVKMPSRHQSLGNKYGLAPG
mgnify:CR=1 FL=1